MVVAAAEDEAVAEVVSLESVLVFKHHVIFQSHPTGVNRPESRVFFMQYL